MKRIVLVVNMCLMVMILVSCNYYHGKKFVNGDFVYSTDRDGFNSIIELTKEAKEKEVIVIPDYLDGKPVRIGATSVMGMLTGDIASENVKKIFILISEERDTVNFRSPSLPNLEKVIKINIEGPGLVHGYQYDEFYEGEFVPFLSKDIEKDKAVFYANVSYYYNSYLEKDFYWIDDYNDELISFIPENPVREGYTFAGWYKEKEGINEWNFANDKIPPKVYDEEGNYQYQETILYAKWILN